jgi:hypothetical protein
MAAIGRVPVVGDEVTLPGMPAVRLRVERMQGRRVDRLRAIAVPTSPSSSSSGMPSTSSPVPDAASATTSADQEPRR